MKWQNLLLTAGAIGGGIWLLTRKKKKTAVAPHPMAVLAQPPQQVPAPPQQQLPAQLPPPPQMPTEPMMPHEIAHTGYQVSTTGETTTGTPVIPTNQFDAEGNNISPFKPYIPGPLGQFVTKPMGW